VTQFSASKVEYLKMQSLFQSGTRFGVYAILLSISHIDLLLFFSSVSPIDDPPL
jgi:hypothetical protein